MVAALTRLRPDIVVSVSATTRPRRPDEVDGRHYHFLSPEEFDALVAGDGLLEWAEFAGRRYGTPAAPVEDALAAGATVVLEIDVQGARQVRARLPGVTAIFLLPPDMDTLRHRLALRGTEDPADVARRMAAARAELAEAAWFDHTVVNDDVPTAAQAIARILDR